MQKRGYARMSEALHGPGGEGPRHSDEAVRARRFNSAEACPAGVPHVPGHDAADGGGASRQGFREWPWSGARTRCRCRNGPVTVVSRTTAAAPWREAAAAPVAVDPSCADGRRLGSLGFHRRLRRATSTETGQGDAEPVPDDCVEWPLVRGLVRPSSAALG